MKQVDISEFKAACLRLLEDVRLTGEPIDFLKNGEFDVSGLQVAFAKSAECKTAERN